MTVDVEHVVARLRAQGHTVDDVVVSVLPPYRGEMFVVVDGVPMRTFQAYWVAELVRTPTEIAVFTESYEPVVCRDCRRQWMVSGESWAACACGAVPPVFSRNTDYQFEPKGRDPAGPFFVYRHISSDAPSVY